MAAQVTASKPPSVSYSDALTYRFVFVEPSSTKCETPYRNVTGHYSALLPAWSTVMANGPLRYNFLRNLLDSHRTAAGCRTRVNTPEDAGESVGGS